MIDAAQHFTTPPPIPNLSVPPPIGGPPNLSMPPPSMSIPPPNVSNFNRPYGSVGGSSNSGDRTPHRPHFFAPYRPFTRPGVDPEFDGKRLRKSVMRKTVDYNAAIIKMLENRVWQRDFRDMRALQPDVLYYPDMQPPRSYEDNAMNAVTTRFVKTATNKMRCPVFCMAWTPEGRRLVTGASSGEFTLWNGLTFNFETILQAHDSPVRTMVWSHNEQWMVTADHAGYVKYWQSNMNNVKMFQGHKEAVRGISFSPSDSKFATCSDDGTIRIWDFFRCHEERILRGHGADVKCVDWHPQKGLIVSGSKDNQQPVKLWDPKTGQSLATLHAHKNTVMDVKWNNNGNWLVTASRDHLLKLFDIRKLNQELQTFRGHKKESSSVAWHPYHEGLFASGGSDGAILFWHVGADKEVGAIEQAHDSIVWTLAWHPLGHILCSGSNDHTSKFWTRNRPGDQMRDKYNLNTMPAGLTGVEDIEQDDSAVIPGMGPEDRVEACIDFGEGPAPAAPTDGGIPGLDFEIDDKNKAQSKKVPYSKPIPRNFQAQWNDTARQNMDDENGDDADWGSGDKDADQDALAKMIQQIVENVPGVVPVSELEPTALIVYGKVINVQPNSALSHAISTGQEAVYKLISSGAIEDLMNDIAHDENTPYLHEDPTVDAELRELQAVELPRRPPLLSTPHPPSHRQGDRKTRRDRKRERRRAHDDDRRSNGTQEDDDRMDDYYDDDYEDPDDTEEIHQRFMGEEEEWAYNDNHNYEDDYGQIDSSARKFPDEDMDSMNDRDLRSLGGPSGMPGDLGYVPDHDQRRLPPQINQGDSDLRAMPRMGDQDLRAMPSGFGGGDRDLRHPGPGGPDFQGDRDFRQPIMNHQADQRMHGRGPHGGPEPYARYDQDHRRSGPKDDNYRRHSSGGKYHEYDDESNNEDDYMRSGHGGPRHRGRWGGSGRMDEDDRNDDDESMRWGQPNRGSPRGRGSPNMRRGRRGGGNEGPIGPSGPGAGSTRQDWDKRRSGLLETPPHMENSPGRRPWDDGGLGGPGGPGGPGPDIQDQDMDDQGSRGGGFRGGRGGWFGGGRGGGGGGGMDFSRGRGRGGWSRGSAPRGRGGGWQRGRN